MLHLLWTKQWRKAAGFSTSLTLCWVAALAFWHRQSEGWISFHLFDSHADRFDLAHYVDLVLPILRTEHVLLVLAMFVAVSSLARGEMPLPVAYFGLTSVATLTATNLGAVENHFLEWQAVTCLCAGSGYHRLTASNKDARFVEVIPAILLFFVAVSFPRLSPDPRRAECDSVYAFVKSHPGSRVLSEDVGALILAEKPVLLSDPYIYAQLVAQGGWSDRELTGRVQAGYFDLIMLGRDAREPNPQRWPNSLLEAVLARYRISRRFACKDAAVAYELPSP